MVEEIIHDPDKHRFFVIKQDMECFLDYREESDGSFNITYTYVPPKLRGNMIAVHLVKAVVGYARDHKIKIVPTCGFVVRCFRGHKKWSDVLK